MHYSGATDALAALCEATGIPVGQTQAGKGTLVYDHPQCLGAIGSTGTTAANAIARDADVVIGIGTRYSDFTTASRTAFQNPDVRFVNINVAGLDAVKHAGLSVVADAREALRGAAAAARGPPGRPARTSSRYTRARRGVGRDGRRRRTSGPRTSGTGLLTQSAVIGMVNELSDPRDVVVCAAGSMPGDLHKLWRTRDPKGYHVEYGYSCMGYEVAGGLGVRLACPDRDVFVMVGDGSYLMMATELATAVQEGIKVITVLVQNHGFASIGALSESLGSQRFGTRYRYRNAETGRLDGDLLPIDLAANAASFGLEVIRTRTAAEFADAIKAAKAADGAGGDLRRDRPAGRRARLRVLVGRAGQRDLDPGVHPDRTVDVRAAQATQKPLLTSTARFDRPSDHALTSEGRDEHVARQAHHRHRPGLVGRLVPRATPSRCPPAPSCARWSRPATRRSSSARTATCPPTPPSCRRRWTSTG